MYNPLSHQRVSKSFSKLYHTHRQFLQGGNLRSFQKADICKSTVTIKPPAQYCVGPSCSCKTALICQSMDSMRPLKMSCGIWHQDFSTGYFKFCKLQGGISMDWTCLFSSSHRCCIELRSGEYRKVAAFLMLKHFSCFYHINVENFFFLQFLPNTVYLTCAIIKI